MLDSEDGIAALLAGVPPVQICSDDLLVENDNFRIARYTSKESSVSYDDNRKRMRVNKEEKKYLFAISAARTT